MHTLRDNKWSGVWNRLIKQSGIAYKHAPIEIKPSIITLIIARIFITYWSSIISVCKCR